jgi:hypothetical protein
MTSIDQQHSLAGNAAIAQLLGHRGDVAPAWMARSTFHGRFFDRDGRHHHRRPIVIGWAGPLFWPYAYDDFVAKRRGVKFGGTDAQSLQRGGTPSEFTISDGPMFTQKRSAAGSRSSRRRLSIPPARSISAITALAIA